MNRSLLLPAAAALLFAQQPSEPLYDEAKVPKYSLPALLVMKDGGRVRDAKTWTAKRRPEILEMYRTEVFGRAPAKAPQLAFHVDSVDKQALGGRAVRKLVTITFAGGDTPKAHMQIYLPAAAKEAGTAVPGAGVYAQCGRGERPGRAARRTVGARSEH